MIVLELEQQRFIRVGAAQVEQVDDPEKNLGTIVGMMKIWTPYADILCFPEISLSGQAKDRDLTDLHEEIKRQASVCLCLFIRKRLFKRRVRGFGY